MRQPLRWSTQFGVWQFWLALAMAAGLMFPSPTVVMAGEKVTFSSAVVPYSKFKIRQLESRGESTELKPGITLTGELFLPVGDGSHPAIILSHDCRGPQPFQRARAKMFSEWGYVALLIDSYSARGVSGTEVCANLLEWLSRDVVAGRTLDIYGALSFLIERGDVQSDRIFVVGWDIDTTLSAIARQGIGKKFPGIRVAGAVSITPDCGMLSSGEFVAPLLVIAAQLDDWFPVENCTKMAAAGRKAGSEIILETMNAKRGFDDYDVYNPHYLEDAYNPNKNPARGATYQYDRHASEFALIAIRSFLAKQ